MSYLKNNKGVSEIVSYSILIIITLAAAALIFIFLSTYTPKETPRCKEDIRLVISGVECSYTSQLNVTLTNTGNFNISAVYIRVGNVSSKTRIWINREESGTFFLSPPIAPDEVRKLVFNKTQSKNWNEILDNAGQYILEIQPSMMDSDVGKMASCDSIISQKINC